jgi:hypothetical protein
VGEVTDDPWFILGCAPTVDRKLIRRAYAARLRETNPEDDAEAFMALRTAYEAVWESLPAAPQQVPHPDDRFEQHWRACDALAGALEAGAPAATLRAAFAAIRDSEVLEHVEVFEDTAAIVAGAFWAAGEAVDDELLEAAIETLRWRRTRRTPQHPYDSEPLLRRSDNLRFVRELRDGTHRYAAAYQALTGPPPWRWRDGLRPLGAQVQSLLGLVRGETPWVLADFRPKTVAWWDNRAGRVHRRPVPAWILIGMGAIVLMIVVMVVLPGLVAT